MVCSEKMPLCLHHASAAAAIAAGLGPRARLGPRAAARFAGRVPREADDLHRAVGGLDQVELDVAADVGALVDARRAAAAAEEIAEETLAEDVAEGAEDVGNVVELRRAAPFQAGVAVAVVPGPLLRMAEDLEGLGGLLELDHRLLVARIAVGVILQRELPVGLGDLGLRGVALDAQDFVVVAFFRHRCHGRVGERLPEYSIVPHTCHCLAEIAGPCRHSRGTARRMFATRPSFTGAVSCPRRLSYDQLATIGTIGRRPCAQCVATPSRRRLP